MIRKLRAIDDPVELARAAKMVRTALDRKKAAQRAEQDYIDRLVESAPPLTSEQAKRLSALLGDRARELVADWPALNTEQKDRLALILRDGSKKERES